MAAIIRMSSDDFLDNFIKKYNYKKFNFLLISEGVKTKKKYRNVYALKSLIPPANVVSEFINSGYSGKYVKKYTNYLSNPEVEALITVIVTLCVVDNSNVVLLCTKEESEYKYLNIICDYIEAVYGVKAYSYNKYKKDPDGCEKISNKVKKKVAKVLSSKLKTMKHAPSDKGVKVDKKEMKAKLKILTKKELKSYCKENSISIKKDDEKSDIIKRILKAF